MKHNIKNAGIRLSRKAMKGVKGGFIDPIGGGCVPFMGACNRSSVCCNYSDGSPVYCSAGRTGVGTCSMVA
jgi:hypothetical protein